MSPPDSLTIAPLPKNTASKINLNNYVKQDKFLMEMGWFLFGHLIVSSVALYAVLQFVRSTVISNPQHFRAFGQSANFGLLISGIYLALSEIALRIGESAISDKYYNPKKKQLNAKAIEEHLNRESSDIFKYLGITYIFILAVLFVTWDVYFNSKFYNAAYDLNIDKEAETQLWDIFGSLGIMSFLNGIHTQSVYMQFRQNHEPQLYVRDTLRDIVSDFKLRWKIKASDKDPTFELLFSNDEVLQLPGKYSLYAIKEIDANHFHQIIASLLEEQGFKIDSIAPLTIIKTSNTNLPDNFASTIQSQLQKRLRAFLTANEFSRITLDALEQLIAFTDSNWSDAMIYKDARFISQFRLSSRKFTGEFRDGLRIAVQTLWPNARYTDDSYEIRLTFGTGEFNVNPVNTRDQEQKLSSIKNWRMSTSITFTPPPLVPNAKRATKGKKQTSLDRTQTAPAPVTHKPSPIQDKLLNKETWMSHTLPDQILPSENMVIVPISDEDKRYTNQKLYVCLDKTALESFDGTHTDFIDENLATYAHAATSFGRSGFVRKSMYNGDLKTHRKSFGDVRFNATMKASFISDDGITHCLFVVDRVTPKHNIIPQKRLIGWRP